MRERIIQDVQVASSRCPASCAASHKCDAIVRDSDGAAIGMREYRWGRVARRSSSLALEAGCRAHLAKFYEAILCRD